MIDALGPLSSDDLETLVRELRSGRLGAPFSSQAVARSLGVDSGTAEGVARGIQGLADRGMRPEHIATMLEAVAAERRRLPCVEDAVDLVTTGPEVAGTANRDTGVVVRELFSGARGHVLVAGYAVYGGQEVFAALAQRMDAFPGLMVTMCLDVHRPVGDTSMASEIVARFSSKFRRKEWPGSRLPAVYYDPRSLELDAARKACLHAKCVVVDREVAFVSSANFTEAAQVRNIEVGVLIRSVPIAKRLAQHFEALIDKGLLERVPGTGDC
jgi:phosphatidylserine/phosphatidylglycerophosphate/cardiolipin synthase-like enzyme